MLTCVNVCCLLTSSSKLVGEPDYQAVGSSEPPAQVVEYFYIYIIYIQYLEVEYFYVFSVLIKKK